LPSSTHASTAGALHLVITIPPAPATQSLAARPAFISAATKSAAIAINGGTPVVANLTTSSPNCTTTAKGLTCSIGLDAPVGTDTFNETLYDQTSATGNILATGKQTATIVAGQANQLTITLQGVLAGVAVSLGSTPLQGSAGSIPVTVAALDPDKQTIVGGPYSTPIALTLSPIASSASVHSASGRARTSAGTPAVQLSLNGGTPSASVTVTQSSDAVTMIYDGSPVAYTIGAAAQGIATSAITPAMVQPKTASTTDWSRTSFDGPRTGYNPAETILSGTNVGKLKQAWTFSLGGPYANTAPIVASNILLSDGTYADIVYVGDEHGNLYGVNAATGAQIWANQYGNENEGCGDMPDQTFGNTSAPLFDRARNRLYVLATQFPDANSSADNRYILALDPASGALAPGWPVGGVLAYSNAHINNTYSGLNESSDGRYVYWDRSSNCDIGPYFGAVAAIDTNAHTVNDYETVTVQNGNGAYDGNGVWGWGDPTIDPDTGALYAGVGNAFPENAKNSDSVIALDPAAISETGAWQSPNDGGDDDFGTAPVPFDESGSKCIGLGQKSGTFYLFDRTNIAAGPTQTFGVGDALASPAYDPATHMLYIESNTGEGATSGGTVQAYAITAGCKVTHAWTAGGGTQATYSSVPSIANGVVYVSGTRFIYALDALSGSVLWTSPQLEGLVLAPPTVVNGRVYALAWSYFNNAGHAMLYCFSL
jgi:hypothetical protein